MAASSAETTNKSDESTVSSIFRPKRDHWGSRAEFILSCIGMSVGFGTIWRFPYLVYKNGGAVFLIPYISFIILVGRPIYFLELAAGQFTSQSALTLWRCCPIGKGIGWAQQVITFICCIYYNIIIAYTIFYIAASFTSTLPWTKCSEWWGADYRCYVRKPHDLPICSKEDMEQKDFDPKTTNSCIVLNYTRQTAAEQYWNRYVLHIHESDGLRDIGMLRWDLSLCLLLAWIFIYLCLFRGIKTSGKVVYVTAIFPYIILLVLIIRGVTLEGSLTGLKFLFVPDWSKLLQLSLWRDSAEQVFFSLGISWGILNMFGSYNRFDHKVYIDAYLIVFADLITSLLGCVAIFSVLGHMAKTLQVKIENVVEAGPGLTFVVYPEALGLLPLSPFWSVVFFIMLFTLGIDSQFGMVESFLMNICDEWPVLQKWKQLLLISCCLSSLLFGLPLVTNGGQYIFHLMDSYGAATSLIFVGFFEMAALAWIYGSKRLIRDYEFMLGIRLRFPTWFAWTVICPAFLMIIFIVSWVDFKPPSYGSYVYDDWGVVLAFFFLCLSLVQIPIWGLYILIKYSRKRMISQSVKPTSEWGPYNPDVKEAWLIATGQT